MNVISQDAQTMHISSLRDPISKTHFVLDIYLTNSATLPECKNTFGFQTLLLLFQK